MLLVDLLAARAEEAERGLGELAQQQLGLHERRKLIDRLEEMFQRMSADGAIDPREQSELLSGLRSAGLDVSGVRLLIEELAGTDGCVRDPEKLEQHVTTLLDHAEQEATDSEADLAFQIQMGMSDYTGNLEAASTLSRVEHNAQMAVIKNI